MHIFKYKSAYHIPHTESVVLRVRADTEILDDVVTAFKTYLTHVGYTEAQVNCVQYESLMWTRAREEDSDKEGEEIPPPY